MTGQNGLEGMVEAAKTLRKIIDPPLTLSERVRAKLMTALED